MKSYILSITISSIIGAFVYIASPTQMRKYISVLTSIILISIIISPITKDMELDFSLNQVITENEKAETDTNKLAAESLAKSISKTIEKEFGTKTIAVIVDVSENSSFDVNSVSVYLESTDNDKSKIEQDIQKLYNCKIHIIEQG